MVEPEAVPVDWTQLPPELLEKISQHLNIYTDYLHLRAVCRAWRSSISKTPHHLPTQLPWLELSRAFFFDLAADKFHNFSHVPELSHRTKRRCGSSHGWLVIIDESPEILLLNPITRAKTYLPPLTTFANVMGFSYADVGREYALQSPSGERFTHNLRQMRDNFIKKIVLSSSPMKKGTDCIALVIINSTGGLAYCRNGDESWRIVDGTLSFCEDVMYHNGLFYGVDNTGAIVVCDLSGDSPSVVSIIQPRRQLGGDMQYIVSSGDEILLVSRYLALEFDHWSDQHQLVYKTKCFDVFRLDWSELQWERVRDLGEKMLFLGQNTSLSLSASDFTGCVGNCIYYTDDYSDTDWDCFFGGHDVGIFRLTDGSFERFPCSLRQVNWPPPIWVTPNPC